MITVWLKAIHVIAIAVWAGGLVWLPGMLVYGAGRPRADIVHLHRFGRFGYDLVVSPAALIAIASGTALIFSAGVAEAWFYLKLAVIAGMVGIHMVIGTFLDWEVRKAKAPGRKARFAMVAASAALASAVLWLVLRKPDIGVDFFPWWLLNGPRSM